ncbi:hypothetical protein FG379_002004 [Cryptosporidium bovis]|uniref:uncharacterized protein n=1 Tax=Cryptosporidium bovis TaxID=310047 RepID=UPI00351A463D|nr:hypothetical protein FG379_002004 [Cryptosporidium bovis]
MKIRSVSNIITIRQTPEKKDLKDITTNISEFGLRNLRNSEHNLRKKLEDNTTKYKITPQNISEFDFRNLRNSEHNLRKNLKDNTTKYKITPQNISEFDFRNLRNSEHNLRKNLKDNTTKYKWIELSELEKLGT